MDWGRPVINVELADPSREQRVALWAAALASGTRGDAELLADAYPMSPGLIKRAGAAARARAGGAELRQEDVLSGIRETLDGRLGDLARRLRVTQTWDDIVLPDEQADAVEDLVARAQQRHRVYDEWGFAAKVGRGLGIAALFSGPPGTGKTMVAGLIAEALRLEIYQADMSKLVSKWIGETEKNLAELFDAAEAGHAILLFDEADSLFGKRTDVKSSNDRHANFETNFLLQRLESFTGICFMTSNHESNIDPAFHRRLSFHVRFSVPEQGEHAALWRAMLPAAAPVDPGVDFDELARRFTMTGGYIKNATLRAAFMASQNQGRITMSHLMRAARLEYEAMGKIA